jgi:hypothetical protein
VEEPSTAAEANITRLRHELRRETASRRSLYHAL